jgi:S1-C subfamily serine protease
MALIPPFMLDCVVAIGFGGDNGNIGYSGTGFLFGRNSGTDPLDGKGLYRLFLATNRHVLDGKKTAFLRFNPEPPTPARVFDAPLMDPSGKPLWFAHPDAEVDVAVMTINSDVLKQEKIQFGFFAEDLHTLTHKAAGLMGIAEGDGVFVLGFPLGNVGAERNYVMVRHGSVARIRDSLAGAVKTFFIDAAIYPGNSGGPVVMRPEMNSIQGTKAVNKANLIGVVSGYLPYQDVAISQQTNRPRIIFEENSGLGAVVPIDRVSETIDAFVQASTAQTPASVGPIQPPAAVSPAS